LFYPEAVFDLTLVCKYNQGNAYLTNMKFMISRSTSSHATFLIQMCMYSWNLKKLHDMIAIRKASKRFGAE
jgi:hypothetical protein